ncbi:MAG: hypothetical protein ACRERS_04655 [Methylococcales bacterium]
MAFFLIVVHADGLIRIARVEGLSVSNPVISMPVWRRWVIRFLQTRVFECFDESV